MLTEDEARQKWCPFARTTMYIRGDVPELEKPLDVMGHAANRVVTDDAALNASIQEALDGCGGTKCLGSRCMAWRWGSEPREVGTDMKCEHCGGTGVLNADECPHCVTGYQTEGVLVGYCGLADKPED